MGILQAFQFCFWQTGSSILLETSHQYCVSQTSILVSLASVGSPPAQQRDKDQTCRFRNGSGGCNHMTATGLSLKFLYLREVAPPRHPAHPCQTTGSIAHPQRGLSVHLPHASLPTTKGTFSAVILTRWPSGYLPSW